MYPILLQLGPIIIYSLWFFAGLGFIAGVVMFTHLARLRRLNINFIYHYSLGIFFWGLVGARIFFVIRHYQIYFPDFSTKSWLSILYVWDKGLSFLGAVLGIALALIYYTVKEKEQLKKWIDILTISIITGLIIGNIGTFLDGTSYGNVTNLPWGILIDSPAVKYAVPIHPVQIYTSIYCLLLTFVLYYLYYKNILKSGLITLTGTVAFFVLLFLQGFFRGDDTVIYFGLREEQWFSILVLVATGIYITYRYFKKNNTSKNA